ncbi:hypothetical protein R6Q59_008688 [Mikania micrantha]|uniref:Glycine-rich protein n=1 Tax=Mikania micrantha TaxID=192012 RepID=A0A5N6Q7L7_9ASTR|nr:hypothetical protein E3N88_02987 [Mikania micrantha]
MKYNCFTLLLLVLYGLLLVSFAKRTNPTQTHFPEVVGAQKGIRSTGGGRWSGPKHNKDAGPKGRGLGIHPRSLRTWGGFGGWRVHNNGVGPNGKGGGN